MMEAALEQGNEEKEFSFIFFLLSERLQKPSSRFAFIGQVNLNRKSEGPLQELGRRFQLPGNKQWKRIWVQVSVNTKVWFLP